MTKDIQSIKERVKALLMKAADAAASPSEAAASMQMAKKLMEKYQVTEEELGSLTGADFKELDRNAEYHRKKGAYLHPIDKYCSVMVGKYCGVVPYMHSVDGVLKCVRMFGLENDVELANWMLTAFRQQFEHDWTVYKNFQMASKRLVDMTEARVAFIHGFTAAVNDRLRDWMFREAPNSPVAGTTEQNDGRSLVIKKMDVVQAEMQRRGLFLGKARVGGGRVSNDTAAAGAGYNSGAAANVGRATAGNATIMIGR